MAKTKEIVFHRPNARNVLFPIELPGIERVLCAKLLGVWLQADMGMKKHVEYIVHICDQRTYLLTQLQRQGLPPAQLQNVFDTIILSRILLNGLQIWSVSRLDCLLSENDFQVEYRSGSKHQNADALSRTSCRSCAFCSKSLDVEFLRKGATEVELAPKWFSD